MPHDLHIRNWERYQHYKQGAHSYRAPVWIKFYVHALDDPQLRRLSPDERLLFYECLLLAARHNNAIPNDHLYLSYVSGLPQDRVEVALASLLKGRWLTRKRSRETLETLYTREDKEIEKESLSVVNIRDKQRSRRAQPCANCGVGGGLHTHDCITIERTAE